ncbi:hypothetical protein H6P81_010660 [Aristolochia fimbriata]|uniref:Vacuolar protein sorting-associated protein 62 n=1 Tax=Aristolochia fimbriata TaxID=158543 RepID=A0AAV7EPE8_ARIFI|nr:hypothetical protein H6P81_010660 [Aristolochia fimbriata]
MGNCLPLPSPETPVSKKTRDVPIDRVFKFPSPLPAWPSGGGFGKGSINLGELEVCQISTFTKIWATHEGGDDNLGATFFRPSLIPDGYFMLGCYCQANNKSQFGWVLAAKGNAEVLEKPTDYTLVWSSESLKIKQDGKGYIWLPTAPEGYASVGLIVTNSPEKPSLDEMRCVRSNLTEVSENESQVWGASSGNGSSNLSVYSLRPRNMGIQAKGVCVGTFTVQVGETVTALACLTNKDFNLSAMPNLEQIRAIMVAYSPWVYLHPDEDYFPSSVTWFFNNGAQLYKQGDSTPQPIDATGSNLPQGGSNDGAYWLDLPSDESGKNKVKKGDIQSSECYVHVKPMLGATFSDLATWVFYPFNGPSRAKVGALNISLGKIGEHVGDWEHFTLRVSNFTGELWRVYLSEHSRGAWIDASSLEFEGGNKVVMYSSLHGHALYPKPGLVLQGNEKLGVGIRNDAAKGKERMECGARFSVVAADYDLDSGVLVTPPWLNYAREWGPKVSYDAAAELRKVEKFLPGKLKTALENVVKSLPKEVLGEEGPTGPKMKNNWSGDEA